jgi:MSHA biogenesis protein MshO
MPDRNRYPHHVSAGFTLLEFVIVILIIGILAGVLFMVLRGPMRSFVEVQQRATLVDIAETALQRMTREIRTALPNSIRISGGTALEFLRTYDGSRYRAKAPGDALNFNKSKDSFDVLGALTGAGSIATGGAWTACQTGTAYCLVIYNTGQPSTVADAITAGVSANAFLGASSLYEGNIATISAAAASSLSFNNSDVAGWSFGLQSPRQRFHVVDTPVMYVCSSGQITRYSGYGIQAVMTVPPAGGSSALLIDNVSNCAFNYDPGTASRAGLVTIRITVEDNALSQSVTLLQQANVDNVP